MKLIYLTDIHGAFTQVMHLLMETVADIYIIAGDLIDIPFYNIDTAINYHEIQGKIVALRRQMEKEEMVLEDFVDSLTEIPNIPEEIISLCSEYQQYTIRARRVMQQKYKVLENIISFKPASKIFCLPGNYDMDLKFTSLHERDLHMHWYQAGDLKIAGYGGADVWTAGIPERYIVKYKAGIGISDRQNEMHTFFKAVRPDIIVSHQPAHGIFDRLTYKGPSGSPALRTFCDSNAVALCLTGHIHHDWGFKSYENTVYLNPSNFGEVTTPNGEISEGGFFYQVEFDDDGMKKISLRKLVEERIYHLADYHRAEDRWLEEINDYDRLQYRRLQKNYDMNTEKYSHIPEIELFKEIKTFFRYFQTQESEERIETLEKVTELMKDQFNDVAMDIVGSVNVGLSQKSSDIDIVLYLRCGSECGDSNDCCTYYNDAVRMIKEKIGGKYDFEVIDCINLNNVERSVITRNYECEETQRFITYRSICRPVNYKVISPIEDLLNGDISFRKEMEGSIRSYFKIFAATTQHIRSFDKYEARLKSIGIKIPYYIRRKIKEYLQGSEKFS
jgi:Icc-related predicted phosphoesterase